jgi:hypothetical protein
MAAFCIYLILKDAKPEVPDLTEELVQKSIPDVEMPDIVEQYAFMSRQKVELLRGILQRNAPAKQEQTGPQSSTS